MKNIVKWQNQLVESREGEMVKETLRLNLIYTQPNSEAQALTWKYDPV
jgi:hypothetical protein